MDWQNTLIGRAAELGLLKEAFARARSGTPKVVAIVAESGFGKTRLAQEFYNWLSVTHDAAGEAGYWPDQLLREADNLRVNPALELCGGEGKRLPFLWWGLRLADPGQRNAASASGMLPASIDILRAHLVEYQRELDRQVQRRRQVDGGRSTAADLAIGIGETAVGAVLNVGTFGVLGIAKALGGAVLEHRAAARALRELDGIDLSPAAAESRQRDRLAETVIDDLRRICKTPPEGIAPVPLVILIDDAQWLEADGGLASFATLLMQHARAEGWPLLLLLTSWRREWRAAAAAGEVPGNLVQPAAQDSVLDLAGVAGLEQLIGAALPGLTAAQSGALARKSEGIPRLLDEMLRYLLRHRKLFADRDLSRELTEAGLKECLSRDFAEFIADRLGEAPEHVRRALGLASLQGVSFSPRLVHRIAQELELGDTGAGLDSGEDPHSFIVGSRGEAGAEFRLRAYQQAARDDLGNLLDETDAEEGLVRALMAVAADADTASESELALVLEAPDFLDVEADEWAQHAVPAGVALIRRAWRRDDPRTAGVTAQRLLPLFGADAAAEMPDELEVACNAAFTWAGPDRLIADKLAALIRRRRIQIVRQHDGHFELSSLLARLGDIIHALDGPAAALPRREEELEIVRDMVRKTPRAVWCRTRLAAALSRVGRLIHEVRGPAEARPIHEEELEICRGLVTSALAMNIEPPDGREPGNLQMLLSRKEIYYWGPSPSLEQGVEAMRRLRQPGLTGAERAAVLEPLGAAGPIIASFDDAAYAEVFSEEADRQHLIAERDEALSDARSCLSRALCGLARVLDGLGQTAEAEALLREDVGILRELVAADPGSRDWLATGLVQLSDLLSETGSSDEAFDLLQEAVALQRGMVAEHETHVMRIELVIFILRLAGATGKRDGQEASRALSEEALAMARELEREQPRPELRHILAGALNRLADALEPADGAAAARPMREEAVQILRELGRDSRFPDMRQDLITVLKDLIKTLSDLSPPVPVGDLQAELAGLVDD